MIQIKYLATTKRLLQTENKPIVKDGFSSIIIKNVCETSVVIYDVIELVPGASWIFENQPYVKIDENINVTFIDEVGKSNKIMIIKTYFAEVW